MAGRALAGAAAALAVAALWLWTGRADPPKARPRTVVSNTDRDPGAAGRREAIADSLRREPAAAPDIPARPASLADTGMDGALAVGADGNLLITPDVRRFFEYFFVATGEQDDDAIRTRIETEIRARLNGAALETALALLDRYVDYRERGRVLAGSEVADGDLMIRLEALHQLRHESFGADDAAGLFADEEAALAVAAAQRRIVNDPTLTDEQRAAQFADLEATLPQAMREARAAVTAPQRLAREEAALREAGGSAEEVHALRQQLVGAEAADRLAALDQRRGEWLGRIDSYRQQRAAIDSDGSLSVEQRRAAVDALRARHFSGSEIVRVEALDRMESAAVR